ncbi:PAN/Apple domain [Sesbania bispinosa]|nr:PAN/Apple domain [Sesbania bispinosa]
MTWQLTWSSSTSDFPAMFRSIRHALGALDIHWFIRLIQSPQAWITSDWAQGCVQNEPLRCNDTHKDGIVKFEGLKVPDTTRTWLDESTDLEECRDKCLNNCSCMAYGNSNISGAGSGCVMWFEDLIDIRQFDDGGQDLYIRMPDSELERENRDKGKRRTIIATTVASICGVLLL